MRKKGVHMYFKKVNNFFVVYLNSTKAYLFKLDAAAIVTGLTSVSPELKKVR